MTGRISRTWADLSMVLVAGIWGATFVIVKNALADIGPFLFVGIRFLLAFLVLLTFSHRDILKVRFSTLTTGSLLGFFYVSGIPFRPWVCGIPPHPTPVLLPGYQWFWCR